MSVPEKKRSFTGKLFSRVLHTHFLLSRGLTIGVRAIVRSDDGKYLLVRHTYTPGWHFPGGGVEKGDTTEQTLTKELFQETGLKVKGKPVLHGVFHNKDISKRDHVLVYVCEVKSELVSSKKSAEIADVGFFDVDSLPPDTDLGTVQRIREISGHSEKEETW